MCVWIIKSCFSDGRQNGDGPYSKWRLAFIKLAAHLDDRYLLALPKIAAALDEIYLLAIVKMTLGLEQRWRPALDKDGYRPSSNVSTSLCQRWLPAWFKCIY